MSYDKIAHLDWDPKESALSLRERAAVAFDGIAQDIRLDLLQAAHEKCVDVLGEMTAKLGVVNITNLQDGDGEVLFEVDGMEFRVGVTYLGANKDKQISMSVRGINGQLLGVGSLPELGRLLNDGKVKLPDEEGKGAE